MTNIHDELNRLTPEPDMDFLSRLDQQIQARIEQEIRNPMITTQGNITPLFDIRRMMLLVGVFLMVLLSGLLLLTISPSPEDDLSTSLIQTTPTIAPQDSCEVEPESGWIVHSVTEDDTLESISQRYAADSQKLLDANCITEIEVGTQLFVPAEIGYAGIVPEDYIPAGVTISEEMVTLAYYPLPPGNKVPKMNEIVGSVALRSFKPNQPFDRDGLGYKSIEIDGHKLVADDDTVLLHWFGISEYEAGSELYVKGPSENCILVERSQANQVLDMACADGTTIPAEDIPIYPALVVYNVAGVSILQATVEDAVKLREFDESYRGFTSTATVPFTLSTADIDFPEDQLAVGMELSWTVYIPSCEEEYTDMLPCEWLPRDYTITGRVINIERSTDTQVTLQVNNLDIEVLEWALENDVEITPVE